MERVSKVSRGRKYLQAVVTAIGVGALSVVSFAQTTALPTPTQLTTDVSSALYQYVEPALLIVFGLAGVGWFVRAIGTRRLSRAG